MQKIQPPINVPTESDNDTKKGLNDYTGFSADERVLYINLGFFKYGTDDKKHAAAIVFAFILLTIIVFFVGM